MDIQPVRLLLAALCVLYCCRISAQAPPADNSVVSTKSALLIGIDTYAHPNTDLKVPAGAPLTGRYEPLLTYPNLKGPSHDVASMRTLLTSEKFGFPNDDKHIHVLLNEQATHDAILQAMEQYLVSDPKPGDTVVLFISAHGSLRADPKGHGQLYNLDGTGRNPSYVENTIVPYDWYLGRDDIFSRDLRHIFNQAAARNIHVTAIFDACHSGSLARGALNPSLVPRDFDFDPRPMPADPYPAEATVTPPENRADNPVLVLSAAQKEQLAMDVQDAVPPHGLFTNALIETLEALPSNRPSSDVFKRLVVAMEVAPGAAHQQPELDTSVTRRQQPLFGGIAGSGPPTAAIVSADAGGIVLDIGAAADIGPGSELTQLTESNSVRAVLQVTDSIGVARSRATVISPAGATVHAKDVVELTKWVPAARPTLSFYAGASNPSAAEIQDALTVLRAAHLSFAADPSRDHWTHHLAWDGSRWTLETHAQNPPAGPGKKEKVIIVGAKLSPAALKKLPPASVVWFDAPLPRESASALLPLQNGAPPSAAVLTSDRTQAMYVIGGTLNDAGISYAWFKRSDVDAEAQTPTGSAAGCSPNSSYPLRTDWVAAQGKPEPVLSASAVQLARLNGWLKLGSSALPGQADFPYRLTLRRVSENQDVIEGGRTYDQATYEPALVGSRKAAVSPRWVYLLSIDCQGKGVLLFPYDGSPSGLLPTEEEKLDRILLPGDPILVGDPLGTDTYLLLTTSTPLASPYALEFKGVVSRGAGYAKAEDPLEDLLDSTSAGSRGATRPAPTNWSIQMLHTQSVLQSSSTAANDKP
jgi:Caspase domain